MADRIKGLTLQINGDTTKLSSALKGVNGELRDTQNALKDVDKLLQMDPKNVELLQQKQDLLNKAISDTNDKLKTLKEAQAQMKAQGVDESSKAYQNLEREIIATKQSVGKLEKSAKECNAEMQKTTSAADKMANAAGKVSEKAAQVAEKTKALSAAAGGVVVALGGMAVKAAQNADELNTMAKQSGLSTEALQKMSYAADLVDVDVETITGAVKKMKKGLDSNADAFEKIGVATKNANGEYRDTESIFYDVIEALGNIENETERDIVAMDLFGKSADELAGIIDDGGAAMKALGEEAQNKGLIISQEELDKANDLNDTLDRLKATVAGSLGQAAIAAAEALAPVLEVVAGVIEKIAGFISQLSPETVQIVAIIATVIAAISPVAALIAKVSGAISAIIPVITTLNTVIAANPVVLTIMGIVAAVALLVAAGVAIVKHWDEIKEAASKFMNAVSETFGKIKDAVVGKFNEIKEKTAEIFGNIKDKISEKWNAIKEKTSETVSNIKNAVSEKFNAVKDTATKVLTATKEVAAARLSAIKSAFEKNGGGIKGTMAAAWEGIKGYFTDGFKVLDKLTGGKLSDLGGMIKDKILGIVNSAKEWGADMINGYVDGIKNTINKVKDAVGNVAETIRSFLHFSEPDKGPLSDASTYMPDFMELLSQGIMDNLDKLNAPLTALSNKIESGARVDVNYNDSALTGRLDNINNSILRGGNTVVKVELAPNISNLFRTLKAEELRQAKALGGI